MYQYTLSIKYDLHRFAYSHHYCRLYPLGLHKTNKDTRVDQLWSDKLFMDARKKNRHYVMTSKHCYKKCAYGRLV